MNIPFVLLLLAGSFSSAGATVTVGWESMPRTFDPRINTDANSQYIESLVHCSIVQFDAKGLAYPQLAKELPRWNAAQTELSFAINPNAKFADGQPVTAGDVVATYQSLVAGNWTRSGAYKAVESVTAKGRTVTFRLKEPDASFLPNLALGILSAQQIATKAKETPELLGCGPYQIGPKQLASVALLPNPHYSLGPKPKQPILIKAVRSEKTRLSKLRAGELDLVQNLINRDLVGKVAQRYPNLKVITAPGLKTSYVGFNTKDTYLQHRAVRRAIAHAIDREPIIKYILSGLATPAYTMLTADSPFYYKPKSLASHDIEKANRLLDQAGFDRKKDGSRFSLSYKTTTNATRVQVGKAIASQLKKVGIKLRVEPMEWGRFSQDVKAGRVQMWGLTWIGFKDPDILRYAFAQESFPPDGGNRGFFANQQVDALLTKAKATTDFMERKALYQRAQELIGDQQPYVYLWHEQNFAVLNRKVDGFKLFADGRFDSLVTTTKK